MLRNLGAAALFAVVVSAAACGGTEAATPAATVFQPAPTPTEHPASHQATPQPASSERGAALASANGCTACHSATGNVSVGPSWKGLYGSQQRLTDGTSVEVDEEFLVESIKSPDAKIAEGFAPGIMPRDFGTKLTEGEIASIVEYLKSLR